MTSAHFPTCSFTMAEEMVSREVQSPFMFWCKTCDIATSDLTHSHFVAANIRPVQKGTDSRRLLELRELQQKAKHDISVNVKKFGKHTKQLLKLQTILMRLHAKMEDVEATRGAEYEIYKMAVADYMQHTLEMQRLEAAETSHTCAACNEVIDINKTHVCMSQFAAETCRFKRRRLSERS